MKNIKVTKRYVDVICLNNKYGDLRPLTLIWDENNRIPILGVKDVTPNAKLNLSSTGLRYTCIFKNNKEKHLYYDRGKWYVELAEHMI